VRAQWVVLRELYSILASPVRRYSLLQEIRIEINSHPGEHNVVQPPKGGNKYLNQDQMHKTRVLSFA